MVVVIVLPFLEFGVEQASVVDGDAFEESVEGSAARSGDT
jgi:hypothetical protein